MTFTVHCPLLDRLNAACEDCLLFAGRNGNLAECRLGEFPQETHGFYFGGTPAPNDYDPGYQYVHLVVSAADGAIVLAPPALRQRQATYTPVARPWHPPEIPQPQPRAARREPIRWPQAFQPRLLEKLRADLIYHSEALEGSPLTREEIEEILA
jgi:hypothetical protein